MCFLVLTIFFSWTVAMLLCFFLKQNNDDDDDDFFNPPFLHLMCLHVEVFDVSLIAICTL